MALRPPSRSVGSIPVKSFFLTGSNKTATRLRVEATAPTGVLVKPNLPQHLIEALQSLHDP
jgi:CheY-like chemotaxis protein